MLLLNVVILMFSHFSSVILWQIRSDSFKFIKVAGEKRTKATEEKTWRKESRPVLNRNGS